MKFVYTADWRLGKAFGRFGADVRAALTEARFDAIDMIGAGPDPGIIDAPLIYSDDALLDLKIEIVAEAAERMRSFLLTRRDRAFRYILVYWLSLTEKST